MQVTPDYMHTQQGIMCCASIEDYETNKIKRHEFTLPKKEKDRTDLTDTQNANVGPVFLAFRENQEAIQAKIKEIISGPSHGDVTSDDDVRHVLWRCSKEEATWFEEKFAEISALYVADGHHRTAAAYNVGKKRRDAAIAAGHNVSGEEPFNYFMTLLYPADNLFVMDYNRVIKSLNGMKTEEFVDKLKEIFTFEPLQAGESTKPPRKHQLTLFIDKAWHKLTFKPEKIDKSTPVTCLDSQMLTEMVFKSILEIENIKTDPRIDFVGGVRGHKELERRCSVDSICAFAMHPISMDELMTVADAGLIMPPKSTWMEPKPRSGFVVRCFES